MTGKNYNWHKAWRREGDRLVHLNGAAFEYDDALGWRACGDTLKAFQAHELMRGVPVHDLAKRLIRLAREAGEWLKFDSKEK